MNDMYQVDECGHLKAYILDPNVKTNIFLDTPYCEKELPIFENIRDELPDPILDNDDKAIEAYWKAWELAFHNLKQPTKENGFINNYINMEFNGHIFMWDTVFMLMFGKYARRVFDFQSSLNNFYSKQHKDGFICREISEKTGKDLFHRHDYSSTGPNIMAWAEWDYYSHTKDIERLKKVVPILTGYYEWFHRYRTWQDGTCISTGWACGMDNQPRTKESQYHEFNHGFMSWIDVTCQKALSARMLSKMYQVLEEHAYEAKYRVEADKLSDIINHVMWNEKCGFYCDKYQNGEVSEVMSIAGYWALISEVATPERANIMVEHLRDDRYFKTNHLIPTLAKNSPLFDPQGGYWRGSVWAPTNYMAISGLEKYGYECEASMIARNHFKYVIDTYKETNNIYENYSPTNVGKGNLATGNFVGWTGLSIINLMIEQIIGIKSDELNNRIQWRIPGNNKCGIRKLPFGDDGSVNMVFSPNSQIKGNVSVSSTVPFELFIKYDNYENTYFILPNQNTLIELQ